MLFSMPQESGPEPCSPVGTLRDYCVIYFGNDWFAENRTSSHHIARRLSEMVPVLYVESPGMRAPQARARDLRKLRLKLARMFAPPLRVNERLHVITAPQIPFRRLPFIGILNRWLSRRLVLRAARGLGFQKLISWFVVPHPGVLAKRLGEDFTVYYCIDDYAAFPGINQQAIRQLDERLTRKADIVFAVSPKLVESKRRLNGNVHYSPHGVDVEMFRMAGDPAQPVAPETLAFPRPIIGYFGNVRNWMDFQLLAFLARSRPQWTYLFVGYQEMAEMGELPSCPNAIFVGAKPYETLPSWAKAFDVAIIPFRTDLAVVQNANFLKLREYLATGKPIVSILTEETAQFADVVYLARTKEDYLAALERALAEDGPERIRARQKAVAGLSWEARFQEVASVIDCELASRRAK